METLHLADAGSRRIVGLVRTLYSTALDAAVTGDMRFDDHGQVVGPPDLVTALAQYVGLQQTEVLPGMVQAVVIPSCRLACPSHGVDERFRQCVLRYAGPGWPEVNDTALPMLAHCMTWHRRRSLLTSDPDVLRERYRLIAYDGTVRLPQKSWTPSIASCDVAYVFHTQYFLRAGPEDVAACVRFVAQYVDSLSFPVLQNFAETVTAAAERRCGMLVPALGRERAKALGRMLYAKGAFDTYMRSGVGHVEQNLRWRVLCARFGYRDPPTGLLVIPDMPCSASQDVTNY